MLDYKTAKDIKELIAKNFKGKYTMLGVFGNEDNGFSVQVC